MQRDDLPPRAWAPVLHCGECRIIDLMVNGTAYRTSGQRATLVSTHTPRHAWLEDEVSTHLHCGAARREVGGHPFGVGLHTATPVCRTPRMPGAVPGLQRRRPRPPLGACPARLPFLLCYEDHLYKQPKGVKRKSGRDSTRTLWIANPAEPPPAGTARNGVRVGLATGAGVVGRASARHNFIFCGNIL